MSAHRRFWFLLIAVAVVLTVGASPVSAVPAPGDPNEGIEADLHRKLEEASRGYLDARATLEASKQRQADLTRRLGDVEARLAAVTPKANEVLAAAYRTGGPVRSASLLLASPSTSSFVDRAASLRVVAARTERQVRELLALRGQLAAAKGAIDDEVRLQEQQLAVMAKRKADAERALADYGGEPATGPAQPPPPQQPPPPGPPRPARPPRPPPPPPAPGHGGAPRRRGQDPPTTRRPRSRRRATAAPSAAASRTRRPTAALRRARCTRSSRRRRPASPGSCRATAACRTAVSIRSGGRATSRLPSAGSAGSRPAATG